MGEKDIRIGVLAAAMHLPEKKADRCIVMCHGLGGQKDEDHSLFIEAANEFCKAGFAVLRFDFRGAGKSPGRLGGVYGQRDDLLKVLDWVEKRYRRIGLLGISYGSYTIIKTHDSRMRCFVSWSGFAFREIMPWPIRLWIDMLVMRKIRCPVLVVHGEADRVVPLKYGIDMCKGARKPKKMVVVEGGDHTFHGKKQSGKAIRESLAWFKRYL